jgi:hypothetical protein
MEGLERRSSSSKRIDVIRPVAVFAEGRSGILRGKTRNISTGGCSINLDDVLEIGENVLFRIDLGEGFDPAVQSATIVWADAEQGRVGVRFMGDQVQGPAEPDDPLPSRGSIVKLSIEKMDKPLRVICQDAGKEVIMLRTSIPFLETLKKVTMHYQDGSGKERRIDGTLTDVALEKIDGEPVPFINLAVAREGSEKAAPPKPPAGSRLDAHGEDRDAGEAGTRDEEDTQPDIQLPEAVTSQPATAASEEALEHPGPSYPTIGIDENITPRYVIFIRKAARIIVALTLLLCAKLRPLALKVLPAAKNYGPVAAKKTGAVLYALMSGLRRTARSLRQLRGGQRRTRMTMRRQVPRTRTALAAVLAAKGQVLLVAVTLCAFTAGIWGLVKLFRSNNEEDLPQPPGKTLPQLSPGQGSAPAAGVSFDVWGAGEPRTPAPPAKVSAAAVALPAVQPQAPAQPVDPDPEPAAQIPAKAEVIDMEDTLVKGSAAPAEAAVPPAETLDTDPPKEDPPPGKVKELPVLVDKSVRLHVKGEIYGFKHYPLKEPAGLVVDVKGAQPLLPSGKKDLGGAKVKSLKTIKKDDGARFIILFNGKTIPPFEIITRKDRIDVKFM